MVKGKVWGGSYFFAAATKRAAAPLLMKYSAAAERNFEVLMLRGTFAAIHVSESALRYVVWGFFSGAPVFGRPRLAGAGVFLPPPTFAIRFAGTVVSYRERR